MDNTGYTNAFSDAKRSELLLKDLCDHLLEDPHMCFVTTKELEDPNWIPPFKHGLIILNLTVHCDEATPGVHLTCIPYSRGCKRGPAVQASMGKAMTGMGYPSTWKDTLDSNGNKIPKQTKSGEIIHNSDGSVRYQQEPDKQGIIDWIEDQKLWVQQEMAKRYGWAREYKGCHPRGNLSTPDYKAARAKERKDALEKAAREELNHYLERVRDCTIELQSDVMRMFENSSVLEKVLHYLQYCPEEDYVKTITAATNFWYHFAATEEQKTRERLTQKIKDAEANRTEQNHSGKKMIIERNNR